MERLVLAVFAGHMLFIFPLCSTLFDLFVTKINESSNVLWLCIFEGFALLASFLILLSDVLEKGDR